MRARERHSGLAAWHFDGVDGVDLAELVEGGPELLLDSKAGRFRHEAVVGG